MLRIRGIVQLSALLSILACTYKFLPARARIHIGGKMKVGSVYCWGGLASFGRPYPALPSPWRVIGAPGPALRSRAHYVRPYGLAFGHPCTSVARIPNPFVTPFVPSP